MKNILYTILILTLLVSVSSCGDDYFDVNTPSSAVDYDDLGMKDLLAPAIYSTVLAQYNAESTFGNYCQYFGSYGSGAIGETQNGGTWSQIYLNALPNLSAISDKAAEAGSNNYTAVAQILTAVNIALATDSWGSVPYTDAVKGTSVVHPTFDSQESIYNEVVTLLTSAISLLDAGDNSSFTMGSDDIVYGGDMDKWKRAAYTFLARTQLHLVKKGNASLSDVINSVNNGFTSNDDDFQMNYPSDQNNPWYSIEVLSKSTGNFHHAPNDQLISLMNGSSYPFTGSVNEDPRLSELFSKEGDQTAPWRGFMNGGAGESSDGEDANTFFKAEGYHTTSSSPLIIITFAEAMFIKAEAEFLNNGGTMTSSGTNSASYLAYTTGILANMEKLGVDGTAYLTDASVDVGEGALELNNIMREKYIANFLNVETYNDMRRYNFSDDVFKGLALRLEDEDPDPDYPGKWFQRAEYPSTERNSNEQVVIDNQKGLDVPIWWAN